MDVRVFLVGGGGRNSRAFEVSVLVEFVSGLAAEPPVHVKIGLWPQRFGLPFGLDHFLR